MATDIAGLIERLEAATGADRELDALIEVRVRWFLAAAAGVAPEHRAKWTVSRDFWVEDSHIAYKPEPVTASIDAALALVKRVRPGWGFYLRQDADGCGAGLVPTGLSHVTLAHCEGPTPAIALCLALLRALETEDDA